MGIWWWCSMATDTKSMIIDISTTLFQQKGYKGVGLNEILKECKITKGSLYHHFPNGKEELLIACLDSMSRAITTDIEDIFNRCQTTREAVQVMLEQLIGDYERQGTIAGYASLVKWHHLVNLFEMPVQIFIQRCKGFIL